MYRIIQGKKLGRTIGFPTLNLEPAKLDADFGVYGCKVFFASDESFQGILHYGLRETTDQKITLEIHLFDFKKDVYGEEINLILGKKIRGIKKFNNLKELKKQILQDIKTVKQK